MGWVSSCSASASPGASSHATISIFTALWIWLECWPCSCCHFKPKCNHSHAQSCADPSQRWLLSDRDTSIFTLYWKAISPSVGFISKEKWWRGKLGAAHQPTTVHCRRATRFWDHCLKLHGRTQSLFNYLLAGQITWSFHVIDLWVFSHLWDVSYWALCCIPSGGAGEIMLGQCTSPASLLLSLKANCFRPSVTYTSFLLFISQSVKTVITTIQRFHSVLCRLAWWRPW